MIPKIWSATDRTFSHFGPFFALLPLPRPPLNNPKDQNFEKMKKNPRDIIILHKCTITIIWQSYDIWFLRYQLQDIFFCYLGPFFALLPPPPNSPKNENIKKSKIILDIWSFYTNVPKIMIIAYTVSEIWHVMGLIVIFHYGLFFPFYPCNSLKNDNFTKI